MPLHRLIYTSRSRCGRRGDVAAILESAERNNAAASITGMLLFDRNRFVQLLEGPRDRISALFVGIAQDERHTDVEILVAGAIESRIFADWRMHEVPEDGERRSILARYSSGPEFDPREMSVSAIEHLCLDFAAAAASAELYDRA